MDIERCKKEKGFMGGHFQCIPTLFALAFGAYEILAEMSVFCYNFKNA